MYNNLVLLSQLSLEFSELMASQVTDKGIRSVGFCKKNVCEFVIFAYRRAAFGFARMRFPQSEKDACHAQVKIQADVER